MNSSGSGNGSRTKAEVAAEQRLMVAKHWRISGRTMAHGGRIAAHGWRMANNGRMVAGQMAMDKDGGETTPMDKWRQEKKKKKEEKEGSGWE